MHTSPRKLRAFRPESPSLEARNAVSSLLTTIGLETSALQPIGERVEEVPEGSRSPLAPRVAASIERKQAEQVSRPGQLSQVSRRAGREGIVPTSQPTPLVRAAGGLQADSNRPPLAASLITLSSALFPQSGAGATSQVLARGGISPARAPGRPISSSTSGGSEAGVIRPMTLTPSEASPGLDEHAGVPGPSLDAMQGQSIMTAYSSATPPTGTDDPPPTVTISGPGRHPGSTAIPPRVTQGSSFMADYSWTQPTSSGGGRIVTYTPIKQVWTYPSGTVKGYGGFEERAGDPDGNYWAFVSQPDNTPEATQVEMRTMTADDAELDQSQLGDHMVNRVFWGPEVEAFKTIVVDVTFQKYINNQPSGTVTASDRVTYDVVRPRGALTVNRQGTAGVSAKNSNGNQYMEIDRSVPSPGALAIQNGIPSHPVGIDWTATMNPYAADGQLYYGSFGVSQTVFSENRRSTATVTEVMPRLRSGTTWQHPGTTTDTGFLYSALVDGYAGTPVRYTRVTSDSLRSFDNPAQHLVSPYTSWSTSDDFTNTLMYIPSTSPTPDDLSIIWVPVGRFFWGWDATANYTAALGTWAAAATAQDLSAYSTPANNSFFPVYSYTIQSLSAQWVIP